MDHVPLMLVVSNLSYVSWVAGNMNMIFSLELLFPPLLVVLQTFLRHDLGIKDTGSIGHTVVFLDQVVGSGRILSNCSRILFNWKRVQFTVVYVGVS